MMEYLPMQLELFGLGMLCIVLPILIFIIGILVAIWVYKDAESRGMSGVLWLLITWLLFPIGLIIYLVVRNPKQTGGMKTCMGCGQQVGVQYMNCPFCGRPTMAPGPQPYGQYPPPPPAYQQPPPPPAYQQQPPAQETRVCMGCGRQVPVAYNICPHCGMPRQ